MKCRICKRSINPKRDRSFYIPYRSRTGCFHRLRWCEACDKQRPDEVEAIHVYVDRIDRERHSEEHDNQLALIGGAA